MPAPITSPATTAMHQVAERLVVAAGATQQRTARAEQQDREREHDDPPGEQPRARVVVVR